MNYANWRSGIPRIVCAAIGLSVLLIGGCQSDAQPKPRLSAQAEDTKFQAAANPKPNAHTLYAMATVLAGQGKDAECESVLKRTIVDYPTFMPAYCALAELQIRQRRMEQARQTLGLAHQVHPTDPVVLNNLGMCWLVCGSADKALNLFTEAAALAPEDARYRANMATALGLMGRRDEALALYEQILPPAEARQNMAILARAKANYAQAPRANPSS